ncbi:MAG: hypothetical protein K5656_09160 [Lachnospiraceae bacterium]|nr:hypothetical protein [Lachnospiraceae bacterium]
MRGVVKVLATIIIVVLLVETTAFVSPSCAATTYTKAKLDSIIASKNKIISSYNSKISSQNKKITNYNKKITKLKKKKTKYLKKAKKIKKSKNALKKMWYKNQAVLIKVKIADIKGKIKACKTKIKGYNAEIKTVNGAIDTVKLGYTWEVDTMSIDLDGDIKLDVNEDYIINYKLAGGTSLYPTDVKWASSNKSVAKIATYNGDVTLSIVGYGDATISATATASGTITSMNIHVDLPNAYVENMLVSSRDVTIKLSEGDYTDSYQLVFADSSLNYNEDLEWTCSDLDIATISWTTDSTDSTKGSFTIHPNKVGDVRISIISDYSEGGTTIDVHVIE